MPRLTEQEQQEIIRFLEADKPLPEKFRFLLFEDKREVELVWNGKTNEVCNVVMPFQIIEHVDEPRGEKDIFDNRLIFGDNLLALKALEQEFAGKVKCVFINPPHS